MSITSLKIKNFLRNLDKVGYSFLNQLVTHSLFVFGLFIFFEFSKSTRVQVLARSVIRHPSYISLFYQEVIFLKHET